MQKALVENNIIKKVFSTTDTIPPYAINVPNNVAVGWFKDSGNWHDSTSVLVVVNADLSIGQMLNEPADYDLTEFKNANQTATYIYVSKQQATAIEKAKDEYKANSTKTALIKKSSQELKGLEVVKLAQHIEERRSQRNMLLLASDKFLLADYPITPADLIKIKTYRKSLRDYPATIKSIKTDPGLPTMPAFTS